jgi:hypothetical protein
MRLGLAIAGIAIMACWTQLALGQNQSQQSGQSRTTKGAEPEKFVPPVHFKPLQNSGVAKQTTTRPVQGSNTQRHRQAAVQLTRYSQSNETNENDHPGEFSGNNARWQQQDQSRSPIGTGVTPKSVLQRSPNSNQSINGPMPVVDGNQFDAPVPAPHNQSRAGGFVPPATDTNANPLRQPSGDITREGSGRSQSIGGQRIETFPLGNTRSIGYQSNLYQEEEIGQPGQNQRGAQKSCDDLRAELLGKPITSIELNISPARRREKPAVDQLNRNWTDTRGTVLAKGTFLRLVHGYAIIQTASGEQSIPYQSLSENDLAVIAEYWELPQICRLDGGDYMGRYWVCQTLTWKASALCHKPLYFEDIQLERYGHSAGPIQQPIRSTAHFFGRLITLPYQGGIHPPNECVYALGFYRPGDCAPWLVDPIPLSLRGAARQATSAVGAAFIYP